MGLLKKPNPAESPPAGMVRQASSRKTIELKPDKDGFCGLEIENNIVVAIEPGNAADKQGRCVRAQQYIGYRARQTGAVARAYSEHAHSHAPTFAPLPPQLQGR